MRGGGGLKESLINVGYGVRMLEKNHRKPCEREKNGFYISGPLSD